MYPGHWIGHMVGYHLPSPQDMVPGYPTPLLLTSGGGHRNTYGW